MRDNFGTEMVNCCFLGPYPGRRLKKDCFPTLNLPSASSDAGCCSKIDETPVNMA